MEQIEQLRSEVKDIDERLRKVEISTNELSSKDEYLKEIVSQNVEMCRNLNDTVQDIGKTMIKVTSTLDNMNTKIDSVREDVGKLSVEVNEVKEERSINFISWIKDKWFTIVLGVALAYQVISSSIK